MDFSSLEPGPSSFLFSRTNFHTSNHTFHLTEPTILLSTHLDSFLFKTWLNKNKLAKAMFQYLQIENKSALMMFKDEVGSPLSMCISSSPKVTNM